MSFLTSRERRLPVIFLSVVVVTLPVKGVFGAPLVVVPSIEVSEKYTDNLFLDSDNTQSDRVTLVNPGLSARYGSRVVSLAMDYDYYQQKLSRNHDLDGDYQTMDASVRLQPFKTFSISGLANVSYEPISYANLATSDIIVGNQFERVSNGYISPELNIDRDQYYFLLRGVQGKSRYRERPALSSDSSMVELEAGSQQDSAPLAISVTATQLEVEYPNSVVDNSSFDTVALILSYQMTSKFSLYYKSGRERYISDTSPTSGEYEKLWALGMEYRPRESVLVKLEKGKRFYGTSYEGTVSFEKQRLQVDLTYKEEVTTSSLSLLETGGSDDVDFGTYVTESNDIVLSREARSRIAYDLGRSELSLESQSDRRSTEATGASEHIYINRVSWQLETSMDGRLTISNVHRRSLSQPIGADVRDVDSSARFEKAMSSMTDIAFALRRLSRERGDGVGSFIERQAEVSVEVRFE